MQYVATCKHELFSIHINFISFISMFFFQRFLLFSPYGKCISSFVSVFFYCVGAGITTLMSISDGSDPYFCRRKMENTRSVKEEMDGEMFISRQSRHLFLYKYYD